MKMNDSGSSLVEVMLAMVIILILILGGAGFVYHSTRDIGLERNKRISLEIANSRLEDLHATPSATYGPLAENFNVYYVKKQGTDWVVSTTDPLETASINNLTNVPITTTVQYADAQEDSPPNSYDYIHVIVRVGYRPDSTDRVTLETYLAR